MNFKSPEEALSRTIDTNNSTSKLENKLTQEEMRELVRNLDVTKIQNLEFKNALIDVAPDAKEILGDKNNFKESLLALSCVSNISAPMTKEKFISWSGKNSVLLNEPDWEKIEKNGALYVHTYMKNLCFENEKTWPYKKLYELFTETPNPQVIAELEQKYKNKDPELMQKIEEYKEQTDSEFGQQQGSIGYVYALEEKIHRGENDYERGFDEASFPTVTFNYSGHTFEVFRNPSDNTADASLQNNDNPNFLKRFGSWYNLKIDGQQYKEKTYDPNTILEGSGGIYDGFNSWRKWIGYRDVVVKEAK